MDKHAIPKCVEILQRCLWVIWGTNWVCNSSKWKICFFRKGAEVFFPHDVVKCCFSQVHPSFTEMMWEFLDRITVQCLENVFSDKKYLKFAPNNNFRPTTTFIARHCPISSFNIHIWLVLPYLPAAGLPGHNPRFCLQFCLIFFCFCMLQWKLQTISLLTQFMRCWSTS